MTDTIIRKGDTVTFTENEVTVKAVVLELNRKLETVEVVDGVGFVSQLPIENVKLTERCICNAWYVNHECQSLAHSWSW